MVTWWHSLIDRERGRILRLPHKVPGTLSSFHNSQLDGLMRWCRIYRVRRLTEGTPSYAFEDAVSHVRVESLSDGALLSLLLPVQCRFSQAVITKLSSLHSFSRSALRVVVALVLFRCLIWRKEMFIAISGGKCRINLLVDIQFLSQTPILQSVCVFSTLALVIPLLPIF